MSKFKVGAKVIYQPKDSDAMVGTIRARNERTENKRTTIEYMVDFGTDMNKWKILSKKDLEKLPQNSHERQPFIKEYSYNNCKIVFVGVVQTKSFIDWPRCRKCKELSIGYAIYNGTDDYNADFGIKLAKHRAKTKPFCQMGSLFSGEFNNATIEAIMDAKMAYMQEHWNKFFHAES